MDTLEEIENEEYNSEFATEMKVAQAVQEALAMQKAELLNRIDELSITDPTEEYARGWRTGLRMCKAIFEEGN